MESMLFLSVLGALVLIIVAVYAFSGTEDKKEKHDTGSSADSKSKKSTRKGEAPASKIEIKKISKNLSETLKRLKSEYPPDPRLVAAFRGLMFSGDIQKLYEAAKGGYIEIATNLAQKLLEDSKSHPDVFMSLITSLGAICTMDDRDFKMRVGNKEFIKTLSDACEKYKNNAYFLPADREKFINTILMILAGMTVADETVRPVLKAPNLFRICTKGIYQENSSFPAAQFYMNASFDDYGRELLRKCKPKFYEALVEFLVAAPPTFHEVYEQIYVTISNLYLHSDEEFKKKFTATLVDAGFFKTMARDIRRLQLDAIGLLMNISQSNKLYEGMLSYELLDAVAHATSLKQCSKQHLESISSFLYNLVVTKQVPVELKEIGAQTPLQKLTECQDTSVAEYAQVLLTKLNTLTGDVETVERKCSNANCEVHNDKMKKCSQCSSVWYCSKECQVNDWPQHKAACLKLKERDESMTKQQATQHDKQVAVTFMNQHVPDFDIQAKKQHLNLDQSVVVVDFTKPLRQKVAIYSISDFFSTVAKKAPFTNTGRGDLDLPRIQQGHATCGQPAFVGVVIQSTSISAFIIPLVYNTKKQEEEEEEEN